MNRIDEKIDKYLMNEGSNYDGFGSLRKIIKRYSSDNYHEEANEVAKEVQRLIRSKGGEMKAAKYLRDVIRKGVHWNEDAVQAAEEMMECF